MMKNTENNEPIGPIVYDPFVLRQFKQEFKGTNLAKTDAGNLLDLINVRYQELLNSETDATNPVLMMDSDSEFCKYLVFSNSTPEIKSQVAKIDLSIYPYIRTGYSARTPDELPVMSRWAELPPGFAQPTAAYVVCVLYTREQLSAEFYKKIATDEQDGTPFYLPDSVKYGIVAIMGTMEPDADPLIPVTMMRNALGMEEGGNGVELNRESYMKSVQFWETHVMIK